MYKFYKRLYSVKYENILIAVFIPLAILQFLKANTDFKLMSIATSLLIYGGFSTIVKIMRIETLEQIKKNSYEPILNIYEVIVITRIIKKEVIKKARYINDQAYILIKAFLKQLLNISIS